MSDHELVKPAPRADDENAPELPLFLGVDQVLHLVEMLYQRRRRAQRRAFVDESATTRRGPKWLPLMCLVRPESQSGLLPGLSAWLKDAEPHRIPHALVSLAPDRAEPVQGPHATEPRQGPITPDDVEIIRDNLRRVAVALASPRNGRIRRPRFKRFGLADWLMSTVLSDSGEPADRQGELRKALRKRSSDRLGTVEATVPETTAPTWWWYVRTALNLVVPLWFHLRISGDVAWPGRVAWYFRHQRYLAPDDPGTFLGFAERLTRDEWRQESPEQVARFLVNVFLEDLRAEYRGPFWSAGRRRTSYALVLLNNITRHNGGYALLKTINDVRNDVGRHDPLLLITASTKVPPHAAEPYAGDVREVVFDAAQARTGYKAWLKQLTANRRKRREMAFYLPISTFETVDDERARTLRQQLRGRDNPTLTRPPWWSRRTLWLVIAAVLLGAVGWAYASYSYAHCGSGLSWPGVNPTLSWQNGECVGITDGSYDFFAQRSTGAGSIADEIALQNERADREHADHPERAIVTISYIGAFNSDNALDSASQFETLAGVALAQRQNLGGPPSSGPLVRVLMANAGDDMKRGHDVAKQLVRLPAQNPAIVGEESPLIGAVGFDHSSEQTRNAVDVLNNAGLPVVAAPLSSDALADTTKYPFYRSVAPTNRREAQVAAAFATELARDRPPAGLPKVVPEIHVFHSEDRSDTYSQELNEDLHEAVPEEFQVRDHTTRVRAPKEAGRLACRSSGLVYFAGRGTEFEPFLEGVSEECSTVLKQPPPPILASDDVSRFVADKARNSQVPFFFESFAVAPDDSSPENDPNLLTDEKDTYTQLANDPAWRRHRGNGNPGGARRMDGHALLAHTATNSLLRAAENRTHQCADPLDRRDCVQPSPGSVLRQFLTPDSPPSAPKPISIVEVPQGATGQTRVVGACGGWRPQLRHCPEAQP